MFPPDASSPTPLQTFYDPPGAGDVPGVSNRHRLRDDLGTLQRIERPPHVTAPSSPSTTPAADELERLVGLARAACTAYGRDDLSARVGGLGEALSAGADNRAQVIVVGEFKQGKSSLVNALLGATVCPVDDDIATAVPTSVRHGSPAVHVVARPRDRPDAERQKFPIDPARMHDYATEAMADQTLLVDGIDVELERELLRGLVLIDTPGVGGLASAHATAALGALSLADAALFVTDASQELTRTEVDFLRRSLELCDVVVGVLTKTDFYPDWRKVAELDRRHLAELDLSIPFLTVSSALRIEALRCGDEDLDRESGCPDLVRMLVDDIAGTGRVRAMRRAVAELLSVCEHLRAQFEAVVQTTSDPDRARPIVARLEGARDRAEQLRSRSARWSITLNDGFADLSSDIDHDFRERIRRITTEADAAIEAGDPADMWPEFEPWLVERVSHEVVGNYRFLADRADVLSAVVADHFAVDGDELRAALDVAAPSEILARFGAAPATDTSQMSVAGQGMALLRGSYMGVLMFTMLGSMVGLTLGPIAIGAGLLMGRKSLRDEKERRLLQRRSEARNVMRRYCDEVSFQVGKDGRDALRRVQRQLRDHYTSRAEELHQSAADAVKAATSAMQADQTETVRQQRDAEAELARIDNLRDQIAAVGRSLPTVSVP
jgi:hypothetical protein